MRLMAALGLAGAVTLLIAYDSMAGEPNQWARLCDGQTQRQGSKIGRAHV